MLIEGKRLTPDDVAVIWKCHPETVKREMRRRRLRAFKVGNEWRTTEAAVAEYERGEHGNKVLRKRQVAG